MPDAGRILEVCLYALLNFLPYLVLALYPFRSHLRFSKAVTLLLTGVLTLVQLFLGVLAAFWAGEQAGFLSAASTILYAAFYFLAVRMPPGKTFFTLLMLSNLANLVVVSSKCLEGLLFPALAWEPYRWSFSLTMLFVAAVVSVPVWLYMKRVYTPAVEKEPTGMEWRYLWLIPATFYLIWYYLFYGNKDASSIEVALNPRNTLILFLINIGAFLIYFIVTQLILEQNRNLELTERNHWLATQNLQYEYLREKISDARRAKHDVRHHIALMQRYLRAGDYAALENYLEQYQQSLPDDDLPAFCENTAVNTVLAYFSQRARAANVSFAVKGSLPVFPGVDEPDLTVLLGNLLENALDACASEPDAQKKIFVLLRTDPCTLWIAVDNTFSGTLKPDRKGGYLSSKHPGRGVGLLSVQAAAEKYGGVCRFEADGTMFRASVMLNRRRMP